MKQINDVDIRPRARTNDLVVQDLDGELLVFDLKTSKASCLNKPAAVVWNLCDGSRSVGEILGVMSERSLKYGDADIVRMAISILGDSGLLDVRGPVKSLSSAVSRRELIKKVGLSTMAALPVIYSLVVPPAAHALSCIAVGSNCSTSTACCPGSQGPCCRNGKCSNGAGSCA